MILIILFFKKTSTEARLLWSVDFTLQHAIKGGPIKKSHPFEIALLP